MNQLDSWLNASFPRLGVTRFTGLGYIVGRFLGQKYWRETLDERIIDHELRESDCNSKKQRVGIEPMELHGQLRIFLEPALSCFRS